MKLWWLLVNCRLCCPDAQQAMLWVKYGFHPGPKRWVERFIVFGFLSLSRLQNITLIGHRWRYDWDTFVMKFCLKFMVVLKTFKRNMFRCSRSPISVIFCTRVKLRPAEQNERNESDPFLDLGMGTCLGHITDNRVCCAPISAGCIDPNNSIIRIIHLQTMNVWNPLSYEPWYRPFISKIGLLLRCRIYVESPFSESCKAWISFLAEHQVHICVLTVQSSGSVLAFWGMKWCDCPLLLQFKSNRILV